MKAKLILLALTLTILTGCGSLLPKKVEFFQSKVQKFPEHSDSFNETQRQAAALAAKKADETFVNAVKANSPITVTAPAEETALLTHSVTTSLGPPNTPATVPGGVVAKELDHAVAKFNGKVESFKERDDKYAGKKIEGTGLFSVGYFTYIGIILLVLFLAWTALKIYGVANPIVGAGTSLVGRVSSSVLSRAVSEISAGGEAFKDYMENSDLSKDVQAKVLDLFSRAHVEAQSVDVQNVVQTLTAEPPAGSTTAPTAK